MDEPLLDFLFKHPSMLAITLMAIISLTLGLIFEVGWHVLEYKKNKTEQLSEIGEKQEENDAYESSPKSSPKLPQSTIERIVKLKSGDESGEPEISNNQLEKLEKDIGKISSDLLKVVQSLNKMKTDRRGSVPYSRRKLSIIERDFY